MAQEILRRMTYSDVPQVHFLECQSFPNPWPRAAFVHGLLAGHECWVLESSSKLAGYGIMDLSSREGHLLNLCVAEPQRCKGYGRLLLEHLLALAARQTDRVFLEVRASNRRARRLYVKMGFELSGVREGYYPTRLGREDALIFTWLKPKPVEVASVEES